MEFVPLSHPTQATSANVKRQIHSHAARVAHARARKLRIDQYMHKKHIAGERRDCVGQESETPFPDPSPSGAVVKRYKHNQPPSSGVLVPASVPKIISPNAFEPEPLASFLTSLSEREHFLFTHCESPSAMSTCD